MTAPGFLALLAALLLSPASAGTGPLPALSAGQEYEIRHSYETAETTSDEKSSGTTSGHTTIAERVIALRDGGVELEYDFPRGTKENERGPEWRLPARVFKPANGPPQLLNRAELEARVDQWLKKAKWPRSVCGTWYFTWNAFRVECDPQSIVALVEGYYLGPPLRDGAPFQTSNARGPGTLVRQATGPAGARFTVLLQVDPQAVQRANAESDVVVGTIMQKPVTLEAALREREKESISGTIAITFDTDAAGKPWRQTKVTKLVTKRPDGVMETKTGTETLVKRLVSGAGQ